jgi:flagellar biosynthesis protein
MSPRQIAVALRYLREKDKAPRILAKGRNHLAEQIIKIAQKHGIPIHKDSDLAEVLMKLDIGDFIPPMLYQAIAEILAYLYRMNKLANF